jgi:hypothetical protein
MGYQTRKDITWYNPCTNRTEFWKSGAWNQLKEGDHYWLEGEWKEVICGIPCGTSASYSGGESFPTELEIVLGTALGTCVFSGNAISIPDKFQIWFEGDLVYDSGYRGDTSYQAALDADLDSRGLGPESIVAGMPTGNFYKGTATTKATVKVWAPLVGTAWSFSLGCPHIYAYSYIRTGDFQKENCTEEGYTGSILTYSKIYYSDVSAGDAESQAASDTINFNAEGQANANNFGSCNPPLPEAAKGIVMIDMYNHADLEVCCYFDLPTIPSIHEKPVFTGNNFFPDDGTEAKNCYIISSDEMTDLTLKRRFAVNIARVQNENPSLLSIPIKVRGRKVLSGNVDGLYSLKGAESGNMTMTGSPGAYVPSTEDTGSETTIPYFGKAVAGGADGNIGVAYGAVILDMLYDVASGNLALL